MRLHHSKDNSRQRLPHNFRSLGGLPANGGTIREDAVYRSARLTHLTDSEAQQFRDLRLQTIIDFRNGLEHMVGHPDSRSLSGPVSPELQVPSQKSALEVKRLPMSARPPSRRYYRRLLSLDEKRKPIKQFFDIMADPASYPVLYHCAIGCDRTGVMTALLLLLAGTPRNAIMQDYMASPKMHARRLNEVFRAVDAAGGIEAFLLQHGVSFQQQNAVRNNIICKADTRQMR